MQELGRTVAMFVTLNGLSGKLLQSVGAYEGGPCNIEQDKRWRSISVIRALPVAVLSIGQGFAFFGRSGDGHDLSFPLHRAIGRQRIDLGCRLPHKPDRTPKSYYCPIPSRLDHTVAAIGTNRETMDVILADEGLAYGTIAPTAELFRPTWPGNELANSRG